MTPLGVLRSEVHRRLLGEPAVQVPLGVTPAHLQCVSLPLTQAFFSDLEAANAAKSKQNSPSVPGTLTAPQPHSRCLSRAGAPPPPRQGLGRHGVSPPTQVPGSGGLVWRCCLGPPPLPQRSRTDACPEAMKEDVLRGTGNETGHSLWPRRVLCHEDSHPPYGPPDLWEGQCPAL